MVAHGSRDQDGQLEYIGANSAVKPINAVLNLSLGFRLEIALHCAAIEFIHAEQAPISVPRNPYAPAVDARLQYIRGEIDVILGVSSAEFV